MAIPCFYHPDLERSGVVVLSTTESAHALQSRRLKVGAAVNLIDGQGKKATAQIVEAGKRQVSVQVNAIVACSRADLELTIAVAMPKGDRQKVMVDMLTQLGVSKIVPIVSQYSVSSLKDSQLQKLRRLVVEACKQSQNPWLTQIDTPSSIGEAVSLPGHKYFANQGGIDPTLCRDTASGGNDAKTATVFIGPEGGFSGSEVAYFEQQGVRPIALGQHILRTETAAISIAAKFM